MKCPNCGKETEGSPLECEKCGLIFSKYEAAQRRKAETPGPITKELSHKIGRAGITYIATGIIIIFIVFAAVLFRRGPANQAAGGNSLEKSAVIAAPGAEVDVIKCLVPGKITLVDFFADWCGPCRVLSPKLEAYAASREDVFIRKVNIVSWKSAVTKQYGIGFVPNVRVYGPDGKMRGNPSANYNEITANIESCK